jgi:hypothetical protein
MSDKELAELQSPNSWDFGEAERRPGVKRARAVVSVAFSREDFDRVATCAEQLGKRTSEFIREAALERANRQMGSATLSSSSGPGWMVITHKPTPTTRVSGATSSKQIEPDEAKVLTT